MHLADQLRSLDPNANSQFYTCYAECHLAQCIYTECRDAVFEHANIV